MSFQEKRVLVTGSAGFLGRNLVNRLVTEHAYIVEADLNDSGSTEAKQLKVDILLPSERLKECVANSDIIFHLAGYSSAHMFTAFEPGFSSNVQSLLRILEYAAQSGERKRVVFPSSSTVYTASAYPSKEDSVASTPVNWYAASKLTGELLCKHYSQHENLDAVVLRIFCGYGPHEQHKGIYASPPTLFITEMMNGNAPVLWGDGRQERDFIYVDDVVDALLLAATQPVQGDVFNVGTGVSTSFIDLVNTVNEILGTDSEPIFSSPGLSSYIQKTMADPTKATKGLGFRSKTGLREGLKRTIAFLERAQGRKETLSTASF